VVQRAVVDGLLDLAGDRNATAEVRAVASAHLARMRARAEAPGADATAGTQGHLATVSRDLDRFFEGRDDPSLRPRPAPILLPWP
jgi:hypothetical protein